MVTAGWMDVYCGTVLFFLEDLFIVPLQPHLCHIISLVRDLGFFLEARNGK